MATFALALGAGGARGLAHIHALRAFEDLGIKPSLIAGTSMGSVIGCAACAGMPSEAIRDHIFSKISNRLSLMSDIFKVRASSWESFIAEGGVRLGEMNLERVLGAFLPPEIPASFQDLSIPLQIAATDFYAGKTEVFLSGPLRPAMAASSAIPGVFLPVELNGRFYIDGSATNPCPLNLPQDCVDHVIAIDVSGGPSTQNRQRPSKIDAIYTSNQMMQMSITRNLAALYPETVLLRPQVNGYRSLDFLKAKEILDETVGLKDDLKSAIERLSAG
jgi:NTE family protein